ncbi:MAG: hypothetical protein AMXMBFR34_06350 [Myxococcaceae bacterium]
MQRIAYLALLAAAAAAWADNPSEAVPAAEPAAAPQPPAPPPATEDPFTLSGDTISVEVPHGFSRTNARERVGFLLDYWHQRFGVQSEWRGDRVFLTGRVFGMDIKARFEVSDTAVTGQAADPGWFWRGRAESYVNKKLRKYLNPDYADP